MNKPKVSVVLTARNEFPIVVPTMLSFHEELEHHGYQHEIIVVDNMSTDDTSAILRDRFRRWVRHGMLKVIEFKDKPANVLVRNVGSQAAKGEVVVLADAHLSVKVGTLDGMIRGWQAKGGLWHSCTNIWGDTQDIRCYGYKLALEQKFWGSLSRAVPPEISKNPKPWPAYVVPMASHCCLLAGRDEYLEMRGYNEKFRCYGGGEPYLDLKYWLLGKKVFLYPQGLFRHAFGIEASWRTAGADKKMASPVYVKGKGIQASVKSGDQHLHYSRGYSWNNEQLHFNFMLSAYTIGGYPWLQRMYNVYYEQRKGNKRYVDDLNDLRRQVLSEGAEDRQWMAERQKCSLDDMLKDPPWDKLSDPENTIQLAQPRIELAQPAA